MTRKDHWEQIYRDKGEDEVSWHQEQPLMSVRLIERTGLTPDEPVIDVGGGASHLVDALLAQGYSDVTVLDLAASALDQARSRLGERAEAVHWIEADATTWQPERTYRLWHDRAVFHFLTESADRAAYLANLEAAVPAGGFAVIATFGPEGPQRCSGLPVVRYSPASLQATLGTGFEQVAVEAEEHRTPGGQPQQFVGCLFRRV
ncbi:class I SAM-dependent methyltransferase [Thiohalorhabdus sp.]|uniref:class I SAM-dependent methyltransferase n=1 Tax=Thiohalorhabdus sp. TaxID=3094134 RepID=UPI002FC29A55